MYIEKVFVYLVLGTMLIMLFRMWRNEVRIRRVEDLSFLLHKRNNDIDKTVRALVEAVDKLFRGLMESAKREKDREKKDEENRVSEGQ